MKTRSLLPTPNGLRILARLLGSAFLFTLAPGTAFSTGTVTITALSPMITGQEGQTANLSATFTDTAGVATSAVSATIDWGDGSPLVAGTVTRIGATTSYTVAASHLLREEAPPGTQKVTLHVFETATPSTNTDTQVTTATIDDGPLLDGNPPSGITHQEFSGVGGTNTAGGALNALNAFEAAIGGIKNTAATPQNGGFRVITWDGVAVDGTDFGGNTIVISPNKTVGIPVNRFQAQGTMFEEVYAVSADGFQSVNASVAAASPALFAPFSPTKTFAMFNSNTIDLSFVFASLANTVAVPAATRGFGAIFKNVRLPNTTSIEYFQGTRSLGKFFVPMGTQGQNEFLGELFSSAVVTGVTITCGTDVLFAFDGTTFISGGVDNPGSGHSLVVTDDFVYAEPVTAPASETPIAATVRTLFNGVVATFSDTDPNATLNDFSGSIDWGDGSTTPPTFATNASGGFNVNGSHFYTLGGTFPVTIHIEDLGGSKLNLNNTAIVTGPPAIIVTGADKGSEPRVRVFNDATGEKIFDFLAFERTFKGGVRVATGDVDKDGFPDIIVARGPGAAPEVKVFSGKDSSAFPAPLGSFLAYDKRFRGGVFVAAGDVNGDGRADIVTAPGPGAALKADRVDPPIPGAAPQVKVFSGLDGSLLRTFFGESPKVKNGLTVAMGDVNGDGVADIITGVGKGGLPFVNVFDGTTGQPMTLPGIMTNTFPAFDTKFKGGVFVAAGDLNGDGKADIIVGTGPGAGPHVKVFDGVTGAETKDFLAFTAGFHGGVRVAVGDLNGDGKADIITGTGKGGGALVNSFDGRSFIGLEFLFASDTGLPGGIFVAGSR